MADNPFDKFLKKIEAPKLVDVAGDFKPYKRPARKSKIPVIERKPLSTPRSTLPDITLPEPPKIREVKLTTPKRRVPTSSTPSSSPSTRQISTRKEALKAPKSSVQIADPASLIQNMDLSIPKTQGFSRPSLKQIKADTEQVKVEKAKATTPATLAAMFPSVTEDAVRYAYLAWGGDPQFLNSKNMAIIMSTYRSGRSAIDFYSTLKKTFEDSGLIDLSNQAAYDDIFDLADGSKDPETEEGEPDKTIDTSVTSPNMPASISQWTGNIVDIASGQGITGDEMGSFVAIASAIIFGESQGNPNAKGDGGKSYGLLQLYTGGGQGNDINPETGNPYTPEELLDPYTNLSIGLGYIATAYKRAKADPNIKNS
jgi:hypothetical protein